MTAQQVTIEAGQQQPGDYIAFTSEYKQDRAVLVAFMKDVRDADVLVGWTTRKQYASNEYEAVPVHFRIKPVRADYSSTPTSWRVYAPKVNGGLDFVKGAKTPQEAAEKALAIGIERGYAQTLAAAEEAAKKATAEYAAALAERDADKANRIARGALVEFKAGYDNLTIEATGHGQVYVRDGSNLMVLSVEQAEALANALRRVAARASLDSVSTTA